MFELEKKKHEKISNSLVETDIITANTGFFPASSETFGSFS
jgi:hypothetical protein